MESLIVATSDLINLACGESRVSTEQADAERMTWRQVDGPVPCRRGAYRFDIPSRKDELNEN
jgi:hypothetical protein